MCTMEAQLSLLSWAGGTGPPSRAHSKPSLPNRVTTTSRGPLSLNSKEIPGPAPPSTHHTSPSTHHPSPYITKRSLTRFPVLMHQRPLELVEKELGELSCAELSKTLQEWAPGDYVHMAKPILPAVDSNHLLHYPQTNHPYTPARHHINMTTPIFTSTSPRKPPRPPAIPKIHHSHQVTKGGHTHLAPAGLVASVHRLAPINTSTVVRGRGLHHHHRHK